jgi:autotransporter-associated beta strand protein
MTTLSRLGFLVLVAGGLALAPSLAAQAAGSYWTDLSGDNLWTTANNWSNGITPAPTNDVYFIDLGASGLATSGPSGTPDNILGADSAMQSLNYIDTNYTHTTLIDSNVTLSIAGAGAYGIFVGTTVDTANSKSTYATINGPGAILTVTNLNGSISARQAGLNSSSVATLDMRGLSTLVATVSNVLAGGENVNKDSGVIYFAQSNFITCTAESGSGLIVGNNNTSSSKNASAYLGVTNVFLCDTGISVPQARMTGTLKYNTNFSAAYFRNQAGTGRQNQWQIGWEDTSGTGTSGTGTVDFSLGTVDAMIGTLIVGAGEIGGSSSGGGTGTLTYSGGSINANTVEIGEQFVSSSLGSGTINVFATNGLAEFTVISNLVMDYYSGGAGASSAKLNLNPGSVATIDGNIVVGIGQGGTASLMASTINVSGASLEIGGTVGASGTGTGPLGTLLLSNSTLTINLGTSPNPVNPIINVYSFDGITNCTLNIEGGAISDGQIPIIKYMIVSDDGFSAFTTVNLPPQASGYLSNNINNNSIDLVITNVLAPIWNGLPNNNWDINTSANWKSSSGAPVTYQQASIPGELVTFNDTAQGSTTVNLVATNLAPAGISVSNSELNYTFMGAGQLIGPGGLSKNGAGSLIISNTGSNSFTGTINIAGGLVQMGVTNGLPSAATIGLADTSGATLDLNNYSQTVGPLSGGGTDGGGNITLGTATLTLTGNGGNYGGIISGNGGVVNAGGSQVLTGPNTYLGNTVVTAGTLVIANSYGSGTGTGGIDVQGGAFQLGDGQSGFDGAISATAITNNGEVVLDCADGATFTTFVTGTGSLIAESAGPIYIPTSNNYTGGTILAGTAVTIADPGALGTGEITIDNGGTTELVLGESMNLTNALYIYSKGGALNGPPAIESSGQTNELLGPIQATTAGTDVSFQSDNGLLVVGGSFTYLAATSGQNVRLRGAGTGIWEDSLQNGGAISIQLIKEDSGTWTIAAGTSNTYTAGTSIQGGTLVVDGLVLGTGAVSVSPGAMLQGSGVIAGPVSVTGTISPGDTNAPAVVDDVMTISNTLTLGGTAVFNVSVTNGALNYSQLSGMTSVNYNGGGLTVNLTGNLAGGAILHLFNAGSYSGTFDTFNLPTLPNGVSWDTSRLTVDGTLRVGTSITIESASISGGLFQLTGSNASDVNGQAYRILSTTNLSLPLADWTQVSSGTLNGSPFTFTDTNTAQYPNRFYILTTP